PVSSTIAVVSVRVWSLMLPPTIIDAPISEITPPKPAITAASIGRRGSFSTHHTICRRDAPRPTGWGRNPEGTFRTAATVIPVTTGWAAIARAINRAVRRDAERPGQRLRVRRHHEIREGPAVGGVHVRLVLRIDLRHGVVVEELTVALDDDGQRRPPGEREKRRAIREHVGAAIVRDA